MLGERKEREWNVANPTLFRIMRGMSTIAEIEAVLPRLRDEELSELEQVVRAARRQRIQGTRRSALDLPPLRLGEVLRPIGADDDLLGEMLDDARF